MAAAAIVWSGNMDAADEMYRWSPAIERERGLVRTVASANAVLASLAFNRGDLESAREASGLAVDAAGRLGDAGTMAGALLILGNVHELQEPEHANVLAGAAAEAREALGLDVDPDRQSLMDDLAASVREQLGTERAATAFARGRSLGLDEGAAFGLSRAGNVDDAP